MALSPQEIRYLELPRARLRGYRRKEVDQLLEQVADDLAATSRERDDLAEKLKQLAAEASKHGELEALLRSTLVSAERAAQDMKEQARRESDLIVQEAHAEARHITRQSTADRRAIEDDIRKARAILRTALEALGDWPEEGERQAVQPEPRPVAVEEIADESIRTIAG